MNDEQKAESLNIENATLAMQLRIERLQKRAAQRQVDRYQWRSRLWQTVALTTWAGLLAWRLWQYFN